MTNTVFTLPRPKGNFILGNLPDFGKDPLGFLTKCTYQYSDIVPLRMGFTPVFLLTNPEHIEQVLRDQNLFIRSRAFRSAKMVVGEALLTTEGDTWFRQRRLAQPLFHNKQIASYAEIMVASIVETIDTWQDGKTHDVYVDMGHITLDIFVKTMLSLDLTQEAAKTLVLTVHEGANWFEIKRKQSFLIPNWFPTPENIRIRNVVKQTDKIIYKIIAQRRITGTSKDTKDLLSMLMEVRDAEDGSQMTDKQLRDQIAGFMIAGHETTTSTLSWAWMLLSQHPEVQTKLLAELKEVLDGRLPTLADLPRLRYAEMIVKETLRLYPAAPILSRESTKDCKIGEYQITKGSYFIFAQWVMHRNPRYFENPDIFKPERWTNDLEKQLPRGSYFPFGDGGHMCIGKAFAMMEMVLTLTIIAPKFQLEIEPNHPIVPQATFSLKPKYGIKMIVKKR
ncbi:cytochrome P450 [Nostoc sp. C117]|uniref:cytochrome P450 n=1 Tax=Nostoc sp. C117 TaxID=3349875 RepID=UPI00370D0FA1